MPNKPKWTEDQLHAIDARGGTLIVSAAAGSGKTAVLVERCIRRLTDRENTCDANELLIVTFTRAATAEMRARLAKAIADKLIEDPQDTHLQKQQMLLPSAAICTIDSFCGNLVREHFEQAEVAPDFRMLEESEVRVLQQNAMDQVLEELYNENDPDFLKLVELLATGRDDTSIEENILRLHTYARAYPSPEHWLKSGLALYEDPSGACQILAEDILEYLSCWEQKWDHVLSVLAAERQPEGVSFDKITNGILEYQSVLGQLKELVLSEDYDGFRTAVGSLDLPKKAQPTVPKEWKDSFVSPAVDYYVLIKDTFTPAKLREKLLSFHLIPKEETDLDNEILKPLAEKLVAAVLRFDEIYANLKMEENALDFADTELKALKLLVQDPAKEPFVRTELAETLRGQYKEILIDEYQDTNKLQDTIFAALSRDDLFMVGDVKQSIYRFRQAMPELFLQKKEAFPLYEEENGSYPATVILGKNFRSRKGVLDAVNYTFSRLMSPAVGEIRYDRSEQLCYGAGDRYKDRKEPDVEFHVVVPEKGIDKKEAEARHIGAFIADEIRKSQTGDDPLTYRDFAILLRSPSTTAAVYRKVLTEMGIPVYAETGGGLLDTPEVMTILSFLAVIDNPVQDVPLLSVLLSPLFGFREDEVSALRVGSRKGPLYRAILKGEEDGDLHCKDFLDTLRHYRTLAVSMGAGELLRRIFEETSYDAVVGAMNVGDQRIANLQMLLQYADSYDANSSYGASGFIRYMDRLREQDGTVNVAATLSPNANVVPIMSIHKSKGLEFRICIVADLNHQFNDSDLSKGLILHPELGIGLKGRQPETGFTYPTVIHSAIRTASRRSDRSEDLRVLYVAMTRAKEKLVLTACDAPSKNSDKDPFESTLNSVAGKLYEDRVVPSYEVLTTRTFYEWCLMAFLQHPDAKLFRARAADSAVDLLPIIEPEDPFPMTFVIDDLRRSESEAEERPDETEAVSPDPDLVQTLRTQMSYEYPHKALSAALSKRSASHLAERGFSAEYFADTRPASLSRLGMTPAERGTCLHKFMQFADFDLAAEDPVAEKQRLVDKGFLLEAEAEVVDPEQVRGFFASSIAGRMKKSPRILREHKFAILLPAGRFEKGLDETNAAEEVLIQGIIDSAFEEDGGLILLDYKTDRVKDEAELADRYREQLELYELALEETLGLPVREVSLYSFHLGKEVRLK